MNSYPRISRNSAITLALGFIAFAVAFRLIRATALPDLPNFSPLMAIALCGALVLPGAFAFGAPLLALIGTDIVLNLHYGAPLLGRDELIRYACFCVGIVSGIGLRRAQAGAVATLGVVAANSLLFYLVTNTGCWLTSPGYAYSLAGWAQALTVGQPGFPPTWTFLRNSLVSDLLFTGLFLAAMHLAAARQPAPAAARA
jgi:hypothetical protein